MTIRSSVWIIAIAVMSAVGPAAAQAEMWDATTGFNQPIDGLSTQSTGDLWQYSYNAPGHNSGYTLMPSVALTGYGQTWGYGKDTTPFVGTIPIIGGYTGLWVAPGDPDDLPSSCASVIGWNSPIAGTVNVSFSLTDLQNRDLSGDQSTPFIVDGVDYWLYKAGDADGSPLASGYMANNGATGTLAVSNVAVSSGTMLYLEIGPHGAARNDTTAVIFTVTSVPEPSTVVLLTTCLVGLLAYAWRKRR